MKSAIALVMYLFLKVGHENLYGELSATVRKTPHHMASHSRLQCSEE